MYSDSLANCTFTDQAVDFVHEDEMAQKLHRNCCLCSERCKQPGNKGYNFTCHLWFHKPCIPSVSISSSQPRTPDSSAYHHLQDRLCTHSSTSLRNSPRSDIIKQSTQCTWQRIQRFPYMSLYWAHSIQCTKCGSVAAFCILNIATYSYIHYTEICEVIVKWINVPRHFCTIHLSQVHLRLVTDD